MSNMFAFHLRKEQNEKLETTRKLEKREKLPTNKRKAELSSCQVDTMSTHHLLPKQIQKYSWRQRSTPLHKEITKISG